MRRASEYGVDHTTLKEVLHDIADERGEINRRKLGWWLKRHAGRIVDGQRFVRASGNRSAEAWRVESVSTVSSVPTPPIAISATHAMDDEPVSDLVFVTGAEQFDHIESEGVAVTASGFDRDAVARHREVI